MEPVRLAVLTVSDGVASAQREDRSGQRIVKWAQQRGHHVVAHHTTADESDAIVAQLLELCETAAVDVVLTTGGTGFTQRDVTPEATRAVTTRSAPGIAEAIRARGGTSTPYAWLSRATAGIRGSTLIVNLPGSEAGVRDGLEVLDNLLVHAVQLLRGIATETHSHPH